MGYVGLSLAVLLARKFNVLALDIDESKIISINKKISPIKDTYIEKFFREEVLFIKATAKKNEAYSSADYVIIATPTNYDEATNAFDTSHVEGVIKDIIALNKDAFIIIKSTVPVGFTERVRKKFKSKKIFFSPEFLREGYALYDNLHPSRIIIGDFSDQAQAFGKILVECSNESNDFKKKIHYMESKEAEAVKLFSNTYLAMRIAYFNELDTFAEINDLSSKQIIAGVSDDPRIGNYYNNPSFGYGGYCLPKDTKQLLDDYKEVPNELIRSIIESNTTRKNFIVSSILKKRPKILGIYRVTMKNNSDNFRDSAVLAIINSIKKQGIKIIIFEPLIKNKDFFESEIINDLKKFKSLSDLIIANRLHEDILDVRNKVYTRDLYNRD